MLQIHVFSAQTISLSIEARRPHVTSVNGSMRGSLFGQCNMHTSVIRSMLLRVTHVVVNKQLRSNIFQFIEVYENKIKYFSLVFGRP